jgi:hypothetical protein
MENTSYTRRRNSGNFHSNYWGHVPKGRPSQVPCPVLRSISSRRNFFPVEKIDSVCVKIRLFIVVLVQHLSDFQTFRGIISAYRGGFRMILKGSDLDWIKRFSGYVN